MKGTLQDLKTRRSCRKYRVEQIKDEELNEILEAGMYAPSGMGAQSPIMIVIQNQEIIKKLSKMNAEVIGTATDPFYGAPTVIVVLADKSRPTCIEDGSLVLGNLMNAAHAIGLGSCWIHRAKEVFKSEEGKNLLKSWGVQGEYIGVGHCLIGYEQETAQPTSRKADYIIKVK